ncbi:MAG: hypothetical protein ACT4QA_17645 [Panacagrimonas sp.]
MKKKSSVLAEALLQAHVEFMLEDLTGAGLPALLESVLDGLLDDAARITLEQAVTRDMIKDTARTFAIELDLKGGIPELIGEIARAVHAHPIHARTRLSELIPDRRVRDLLDHALALQSVRTRLVSAVIRSPLYESFASELLYNGIREYLGSNTITRGIPGARSAMKLGKAVMSRATASFDGAIEDGIKRHIGRSVTAISERTAQSLMAGEHDEALRDGALESWRQLRETRLGDWMGLVSSTEVEELFVTLFETWRELRGTELIGTMIDTGIDTFFDKYGAASLAELLEDLGITRSIMLAEAMRFGPHVVTALHGRGLLEPSIRRLLERFYQSGRVEKILARR